MKRIAKKALHAAKNPKRVIKLTAKQAYVLGRFGPREYAAYLKRAVGRHIFIHSFPNGINTSLDIKKAKNWHLVHKKPLVIALIGQPERPLTEWIIQTQQELRCHFLIGQEAAEMFSEVNKEFYTVVESLSESEVTFYAIKHYVQQYFRGNDLLCLDASQPIISSVDVLRLQHAAHTYDDDKEIGFALPSYKYNQQLIAGYEYNRITNQWESMSPTTVDYNQCSIPRYVLTGTFHGLYVTRSAIERLSVTVHEAKGTLDDQVGHYIMRGWQQNIRTLVFSPVVAETVSLYQPKVNERQHTWLTTRQYRNKNGNLKVIYVLNATTVSGGIRVVFEHAGGLIDRGFDVEIWSLQGQPTWTDVPVTVKKFHSYSDLLLALRNEDAIKVATWWETDQVVWLGSVNHGVAVNFIQEFETWFYPNDPIAQAAVVSSYRKEFAYMTTADYQRDELRQVGIEAPIIPVGYEQKYYHQLNNIERATDSVLAVGRSFFQKNFAMTARAWQSIGAARPKLVLFGSEPDILRDERVYYHVVPSNEEVNILYNQATCFVQTSLHEGFSLPVIEAMAAGCPVITTDSHGNRGFCHDGKNCLIVEQGNDKELAQAIERLLGDTVLQKRLRKAGLETAKQYEWSGLIDDLAAFYKTL